MFAGIRTPTAPPPVVVLAPPRPSTLSEVMSQLLLRNAFATELFQTGSAPVVAGVGLGTPAQQERLSRCLVESVAGGWTVGGLFDVLRRQGGEGPIPAPGRAFEDWLAPASATVLATDPESRLPGLLTR